MLSSDKISEVFDYTDEGHASYLSWKQLYAEEMLQKYGMRSKNVLATHFETEINGERKMLVVLQHELKEESDG